MADPRLVPPSIDDERSRVVAALLDRLDAIDPAGLFLWDFDAVPASALEALAWQFGLLGSEAWSRAESAGDERALITHADALQRRRGTPTALLEALALAGFAGCVLIERYPPILRDGTYRHEGAVLRSSAGRWALCGIALPLGEEGLSLGDYASMRQIFREMAPVRSELQELVLETTPLADDLAVADEPSAFSHRDTPRYNGLYLHDGTVTRTGGTVTEGVWA